MLPKYQYRKLQNEEIRLVTILPSKCSSSAIKIVLNHIPLSELKGHFHYTSAETPLSEVQKTLPSGWQACINLKGQFLYRHQHGNYGMYTTWNHPYFYWEALSYAWGHPDEETEAVITVDDSFSLFVPMSLVEILRQLRHPTELRRIWIDRIGINQKNVEERNKEVKRMRNIYRHASRVVVWLGPACSTSALALEKLEELGCQVEVTPRCEFLPAPGCKKPQWYDPSLELPHHKDKVVLEAIEKLCNRSWFKRVWIIQEILLAGPDSIIQCGSDSISWHLFRRAVLRLSARGVQVNPIVDGNIHWIKPLCKNHHVGDTISNLLLLTAGRQCLNPRDKVYGILGLAAQRTADAIHPDYDLPLKDAYKSVVLADAQDRQRLDLLDHCEQSATSQRDWPSWVPNWSVDRKGLNLVKILPFVSASGASKSEFTTEDDILVVTGIQHSQVTGSFPIPATRGDIVELFKAYQESCKLPFSDQGLESYRYYPQPRVALIDAYIDLVHLGILRDTFHDALKYPTLSGARQNFLDSVSSDDGEYLGGRSEYLKGYKLIFTEGGYLGLAPETTREGDLVCVFLGASLLKVLRNHQDDPLTYTLVGQCYIPGLMNGEALIGELSTEWSFKYFTNEWGRWQPRCINSVTGEIVGPDKDPRLGDLPPGWESLGPALEGSSASCTPGAEDLDP
ncbi:heterokaryon incompatibility protein-domain-containing protein [Podospora fimiseda]|uniref:Heterokaryon incompatibility protein-domain-containing protein n=1 Tax=Podospora fimiseda TaxID=252190 RepID=A0AAN6YLN9_9PEZI|nr:heterokaryon incompatibility protein-domain-containing protein [Podospora fimiseda]